MKRAPAELALGLDGAVVLPHDAVPAGQAQARALGGPLGGEERVEDAVHDVRVDARSAVFHDELSPRGLALPGHPQLDANLTLAVDQRVARVGHQVEQQLLQLGGVAAHHDRRLRQHQREVHALVH